MKAISTTINAALSRSKPEPPPAIRAKMRTAIAHLVDKCSTREEAAREAGVSQAGLYKALAKPEVAEYVEALNAWHIERSDAIRGRYRADAIAHAHHLMKNAKSEAVQARMVEFLASERKPDGPSVVINNTVSATSNGYEYVPPGANVVRIDRPSSVDDAEVIENKEES